MAEGSILIVDDEYGVRSGIRTILEMEGYEVAEAADGAAALAALDERDYDVALLDYRLPDTDGLSLLADDEEARLRRHGVHDHGLRQHRHGDRRDAAGRGLLPAQAVQPRRPRGRHRDAAAPQAGAHGGGAPARRARGEPARPRRGEDADALAGQLPARRRARREPGRRRRARQPADARAARAGGGRRAHAAGAGAARRRRPGAALRAAGHAGKGPHGPPARSGRPDLHGEHRDLPR